MARRIAMVLWAALLIAYAGNLNAQGRGGGHSGGGGMRGAGGGGMRAAGGSMPGAGGGARAGGSVPVASTPQFAGRPGAGFAGHTPITGRVGGFGHVNPVGSGHRVVVSRPFFGFSNFPTFSSFSSPFLWNDPFYGVPSYATSGYVAPGYLEPTYSASQTYIPAQESQSNADLSYQVERLSQEIQSLRQEQQAIAAAQLPPAPVTPPTPTVLVYKDGHRESVLSYAIVGQTVWILNENSSVRISLSDLDLDATQKENRSRGVRFLMPGK